MGWNTFPGISFSPKLCSDVCCDRDVIQDDDDDLIHMGHAIVTFYSALIDLLGRCAPEMHVSVFSMSADVLPKHTLMPDSTELTQKYVSCFSANDISGKKIRLLKYPQHTHAK